MSLELCELRALRCPHGMTIVVVCAEGKPCKVSMFRHSLVSNYILSVFAKLPVHPMMTLRHAREQV